MADRQYTPLAEPFALPDVPDLREAPGSSGVVPPRKVFPYQSGARPVDFAAVVVAPDQPWLLLLPPTRRVPALLGMGVQPPVIALPYDWPLLEASPTVVRRVVRAQGDGSTTYGQADPVVAPDLIALNLVSPLPRLRPLLDLPGGQPLPLTIPAAAGLTATHVEGRAGALLVPSGMTPPETP